MSPWILTFRLVVGWSVVLVVCYVGFLCKMLCAVTCRCSRQTAMYADAADVDDGARNVDSAQTESEGTQCFSRPLSCMGWTLRRLKAKLFGGVKDSVEQSVKERLKERCAKRIRTICHILIHPWALFAAFSVYNWGLYAFYKAPLTASAGEVLRMEDEVHFSLYVDLTLCLTVAVIVVMTPERLTPTIVSVGYVLLYLRLAWKAGFETHMFRMASDNAIVLGIRFTCSLLISETRLTVGLSVLYSVHRTICFYRLVEGLSADGKEQAIAMLGQNHFDSSVMVEFTCCCAIVWASCFVFKESLSEISEAYKHSESSRNVMSLLSFICSAVVRTDHKLVLTEASMELADYLLRNPLGNSYKGHNFLDFMAEEDRLGVWHKIKDKSGSPGQSTVFGARLIDANRTRIAVQIYCTCIRLSEDCSGFIMGVLEPSGTSKTEDEMPHMRAGLGRLPEDGVSSAPLEGLLIRGPVRASLEPPRRSPSSVGDEGLDLEESFASFAPSSLTSEVPSDAVTFQVHSEIRAAAAKAARARERAGSGQDSQCSSPLQLDETPSIMIDCQYPNLPIVQSNAAFGQVVGPWNL
eukprot:TRINITY_DN28254_c0_g1_i11.p1 TRINITY_DN28254_c0_g1~~TRINITY_DN28254_c0_g1_i11.p1  ORF type:complete len:579 (+),score=64.02 TRINITY_DN28254_c0_g1_i11:172-1908(+)